MSAPVTSKQVKMTRAHYNEAVNRWLEYHDRAHHLALSSVCSFPACVRARETLMLIQSSLSPDRMPEIEVMAEAVHNAYLDTCERLEWEVRPANLVPYADLSEDSKELDRASVRAVLSCLGRSPDTDKVEVSRAGLLSAIACAESYKYSLMVNSLAPMLKALLSSTTGDTSTTEKEKPQKREPRHWQDVECHEDDLS